MSIFLNIANKPEVARQADRAVRSLLSTLREIPAPDARSQIIFRSVQDWRSQFPRDANDAAVAAFMRALNLESGKGNGGLEVVECIRCLDSISRSQQPH